MVKKKRSIKNRIFTSQITVIVISLLTMALIFHICLRIYIRRETKSQLLRVSSLVESSIENQEKLPEISKILEQTQWFLDINYALIGESQNIIYSTEKNINDNSILEKKIIPSINKKKWIKSNLSKNRVFYFKVADRNYAAILYNVETGTLSNEKSYLYIYSDLDKIRKATLMVNSILITVTLITVIIAAIVSNGLAKKISNPIFQLSQSAKKIGERNYSKEDIYYEDSEIGQLAETMDIMAQKLSTYDKTMKTFMQNASHELRTPLMSIQGYAEGIKYGVVDDEEKAVDIIIEESNRLSTIVEDLLYLTKIDSMNEDINKEDLDIEDLIRSSMERISGIALKENKVIKFSPSDNKIIIKGDEEKLTRALINILGNCLRYSKKYINITIEEYNNILIIKINDDGSGFQGKDINSIFERFYKGKGGNYGLGLAITKSIIERHGGIITASNNINGGACFEIKLNMMT